MGQKHQNPFVLQRYQNNENTMIHLRVQQSIALSNYVFKDVTASSCYHSQRQIYYVSEAINMSNDNRLPKHIEGYSLLRYTNTIYNERNLITYTLTLTSITTTQEKYHFTLFGTSRVTNFILNQVINRSIRLSFSSIYH